MLCVLFGVDVGPVSSIVLIAPPLLFLRFHVKLSPIHPINLSRVCLQFVWVHLIFSTASHPDRADAHVVSMLLD